MNDWNLTGNSGTTPGTHFLGTTDSQALEVHVNSALALRIEPDPVSPNLENVNLISGYLGNWVAAGVRGAAIGGRSYNTANGERAMIPGGTPTLQAAIIVLPPGAMRRPTTTGASSGPIRTAAISNRKGMTSFGSGRETALAST